MGRYDFQKSQTPLVGGQSRNANQLAKPYLMMFCASEKVRPGKWINLQKICAECNGALPGGGVFAASSMTRIGWMQDQGSLKDMFLRKPDAFLQICSEKTIANRWLGGFKMGGGSAKPRLGVLLVWLRHFGWLPCALELARGDWEGCNHLGLRSRENEDQPSLIEQQTWDFGRKCCNLT